MNEQLVILSEVEPQHDLETEFKALVADVTFAPVTDNMKQSYGKKISFLHAIHQELASKMNDKRAALDDLMSTIDSRFIPEPVVNRHGRNSLGILL